MVMLTPFLVCFKNDQSGLIDRRKVIVLRWQKGADEDQPVGIVADECC